MLALSLCIESETHREPAAAAGSAAGLFTGSGAGLSEAFGSGDLLRLESGSCFRAGGDLERLSNREALFGSGSFWSKHERFAVRRSVSSISKIDTGFVRRMGPGWSQIDEVSTKLDKVDEAEVGFLSWLKPEHGVTP